MMIKPIKHKRNQNAGVETISFDKTTSIKSKDFDSYFKMSVSSINVIITAKRHHIDIKTDIPKLLRGGNINRS